jgi:hypothetical protein
VPTQLVNTRGHYPKGYPKDAGYGDASSYDPSDLEQATDEPDLQVMKTAVEDAQNSSLANDYWSRNLSARDWWYARWPFQTFDGRKWGDPNTGVDPWPWPGASDTRLRVIEKIIAQHRTLITFTLRNMKVQAKSARPGVTIKESQQATTLLNWILFTHMQSELHREMRLALSWRNGYGAAVMDLNWWQTRRLNYIPLSVMGLQEFMNEPGVAQFLGAISSAVPIGENMDITAMQSMIMDPAYTDDLAIILRTISHNFLTKNQARSKLDDLRELRTVEIPIPSVFESRPSITALRPMVDVLFPPYSDNLQRCPFVDRIEFVSEVELRDRIENYGYSKAFVAAALDRRGPSAATDWRVSAIGDRTGRVGTSISLDNTVELHHFYSLVQDRGVPVRFCTVFHMGVDIAAKHDEAGYDHGESTFHPFRFEIEDRPILSSRGIPEIAYTWEQELKAAYDAMSDHNALAVRPPLITSYDQVQKMKENIQPGAIIPMRKFDEAQWMRPAALDQSSVLIIQAVEQRIREHFGIFGKDLDPALMKLRQEEVADDFLLEMKPVIQQMMKLLRQFMPEDVVARVVGQMERPFHISKEDLQAEYEISATIDLRNLDSDWLKEKLGYLQQLAQLDTMGLLDKAALLKAGAEAIDYSFADMAIQNPQAASEAEVQDEQKAIDLIIGSGQDQPLPKGANHQLRLQTLQAKMQAISTNPATMKIVQNNPDIMKVLINRQQFFQRQLQQMQNAQIGRMQVSETFSKNAPQTAAPMQMPPGGGNGEMGMEAAMAQPMQQ